MREVLLNNIRLKLLALVLAIFSWYAIRETINYEIIIPNIPVEFKIGDGWAVLRQSSDSVRVTFRGSQENIRLIDHKQIKAQIDLRTNSLAGSYDVLLRLGNIKGTHGVRPVRIEPEIIQISTDRESEKTVPVKSRTTGKPFAGKVEKTACEPAVVLLRGPAQQLMRTEWVYTEPVDVEGRLESFAKRCRVLPPSNTWTPVIEPSEVKVHVQIVVKNDILELSNIPVEVVLRPSATFKAETIPDRVKVVLTGKTENLDELKKSVPKVFVDCVGLDPSLTYDLPVLVFLPAGKNVTALANPSFVHVIFKK
ncbi:MAG: CdaR family protein [Kiritimatiellia bacterium]|nr:CdaR family protein [Kiritimatiellia bacterium]